MLRDVMGRCAAVQKNRLALFNQVAGCQSDRLLGFDVLHKPGHEISLRRSASAERSAVRSLQHPLLFKYRKILAQGGLADFEDRSQFIQMNPPTTGDERGDFLLSLCGKKGRCKFLVHRIMRGETASERDDI